MDCSQGKRLKNELTDKPPQPHRKLVQLKKKDPTQKATPVSNISEFKTQ